MHIQPTKRALFTFLCLTFFVFISIQVSAQTYYFAYKRVTHDTLKLRDSSTMKKMGPIDIPMEGTGARCYITYNHVLIESDSTLHARFTRIATTDKVLYPQGLGIDTDKFPPLKVYDFSGRKFWVEKEKKAYTLLSAKAPIPIKMNDGKLMHRLNSVCHVITDPKLPGSINPGIMWEGMIGGVVKIKTIHHEYTLVYYDQDKKPYSSKVIQYALDMLKTNSVAGQLAPYVNDVLPTAPLVPGTY